MKKLIIIGAGNMGIAIADGLANKNTYSSKDIVFIEKDVKKKRAIEKLHFKFISFENITKNDFSEVKAIILAVKPNNISEVLSRIKPFLNKNTLIISIAAGIKIKKIESLLYRNQLVIRVMPNTPCQIGEGISVLSYNKFIKLNHKKIAKKIFASIGGIVELNEDKLDIVTAISGSGPAYFSYLAECLILSAKNNGLSNEIASKLVLKTALGTFKLLKEKDLSPEDLRTQVTSPNGTTAAAISILERNNFKKTIDTAIKSAKKRSHELSKS